MNCNRASRVFSLFLLIVAIPNFANAQSRTKNGDIPGSATYMPTPEHPVGWRGDGTGRYPAADPPTVWGRKKVGSAYESRNILWSMRMPAVSVATPIVVTDCPPGVVRTWGSAVTRPTMRTLFKSMVQDYAGSEWVANVV